MRCLDILSLRTQHKALVSRPPVGTTIVAGQALCQQHSSLKDYLYIAPDTSTVACQVCCSNVTHVATLLTCYSGVAAVRYTDLHAVQQQSFNQHVRETQMHRTQQLRMASSADLLLWQAAGGFTFSAYLDGCTLEYSGKVLSLMSVKNGCLHLSSASGLPY